LFGTVPFNPPGQGGVFELSPTGNGPWNFQMIYTFQGSTDGSDPFSGVVIDKAGNIYASALSAGNIKDCGGSGCGSVIELSPLAGGGWSESTIFAFSGPNGENPEALVLDNAGNLYGIADAGGAYKFGVAFELSPSSSGKWTEKILHSFGSTATDGQTPDIGELTLDSTGAVYGMTTYGGKYGAGTVYKIEP
jgi:uncharacterized repeat protein (TIGR03803 family)